MLILLFLSLVSDPALTPGDISADILFDAVQRLDVRVASVWAKRSDVNARVPWARIRPMRIGQVTPLLLLSGLKVSSSQATPQEIAVRVARQLEIARVLIMAGADVNAASAVIDGPATALTCLDSALIAGNTDLAQFLILMGADVNGATPDLNGRGWPLYFAVSSDEILATLLILKGANTSRTDPVLGSTALTIAITERKWHLARTLVLAGADPFQPIEALALSGSGSEHSIVRQLERELMFPVSQETPESDIRDFLDFCRAQDPQRGLAGKSGNRMGTQH